MPDMESFSMEDTAVKTPYWEMGQRIIKAREECTDLNQTQMTSALGLREPTYGNYERGSRRMPPDVLQKFTLITGCRADWILLNKGPMKEATVELTEKENRILSKIRILDDEQKAALEIMLGIKKD